MKHTQRILLLLMAAMLQISTALAVPAFPGKIKVKQPDGSMLSIQKIGDEHGSLMLTDDGYPVVYNELTATYEYAMLADGALTASGIGAAEAGARHTREWQLLKGIDREQVLASFWQLRADELNSRRHMQKGPRKVRISDIPTTGKQQSLVILVEFSDRAFGMANPHDYYTRMLNEENYTNPYGATGSARDFYVASSDGRYDPEFVVAGPVKLTRSYSYYGANRGHQSGIDYQIADFVHDAALAADELVDYAQFDSDDDGMVDNIYFFYAGYGEADTGTSNTIWPHSANYHTDFKETLVCDGKYINRYACSQELSGMQHVPVGIGTFVHEYGHVLGLVDLYNTQNQLAGGPGAWDTMASGSYQNNQNTPPLFSAYERASLGWLEYTELTTQADTIIGMASLAAHSQGYRVSVEGSENEFFVIENRQQEGWDKYLPGHGLLVWHIDEDEGLWQDNQANNDPNHQRVDLVEADRTPEHDGGDAFPGTRQVTQFAFDDWSGKKAFGFALVAENGHEVRFLLSDVDYRLAAPQQVELTQLTGRTASVAWTPVADATSYQVVIRKDDAVVAETAVDGSTTTAVFSGLKPQTSYVAGVKAVMSSYQSEEAQQPFTTTGLLYTEQQVQVLAPSDIQQGSFTAHWSELEGTDEYQVSLFRYEMTGRKTDGWDFTSHSDDCPNGWTTTATRYDNNYYGQAAPSLRLSKDKDNITMTHEGSRLVALSFWYRASSAGNRLVVQQYKDGAWTLAADTIVVPAAEATTAEITLQEADSVRIVFFKKANYVQIDDIVCTYQVEEINPVEGMTDIAVTATAYTFEGLSAGVYAYQVVGKGQQGRTLDSDLVKVELPDAPSSISLQHTGHDGSMPCYTLTGQKAAPGYRGIVIRNGRKLVVR